MKQFRDFSLPAMSSKEIAGRVEDALDHSEVLFYELDIEQRMIRLCNCDNCERAARQALQELGYEIERIKKEYK